MENIRNWQNFLKPLQRRQPKRNKNEYDVIKIDSIPSMSRDIALQLEQEVMIDKDELASYDLSLFKKQRQQARKDLFQTSHDLCNLPSPVRKRSGLSDSPIYIDDSEDEDVNITDDIPQTSKVEVGETNCDDFSHKRKIRKLSYDEEMEINSDSGAVKQEVDTDKVGFPFNINKNNMIANILQKISTVPLLGTLRAPLNTILSSTSPTTPPTTASSPSPSRPLTTSPPSSPSPPSPPRDLVTMSSTHLPPGFHGTAQSSTPKDRPMVRQTRLVDHRSTSLSKWTFDMFTKYVDFKKYVRKLDLSPESDSDIDQLTQYMSTLYEDVLAMFGVKNLKDCMFRESNIRVLLDGLLLKLCKLHDVRLQTEEQSQLRYLPTGKFDYLFSTKEGHPLGCVEAKSPGSMDRKAFAQAVLELNLVQQVAHKKGVDIAATPLFCILSDGYRFILMQLQGRELLLEHTRDVGRSRQQISPFGKHQHEEVKLDLEERIRIRKLDGEDDFRVLVTAISNIIQMSKRTEEKT